MIKKIALASALTVLLIPSTYAAGLKVNILSTSALGNANAGRNVLAEDASVVYYNPAAMTEFESATFSGGLFGAHVKGQLRDFNVTKASKNGSPKQRLELGKPYDDGGDFVPDAVFPFLYYIQPITNDFHAGIGFFPAFSTHTRYSKNAIVGEFAGATKLQVLDLQPAIAYKISDLISVGAGLDFYIASGELSKMVVGNNASDGFAAEVIVKGKDYAMGWNVAVKLKSLKGTHVGITYHSQVDINLQGSGDFIQIQPDGKRVRLAKENGNVPLTLARSLDLSFAQEMTKSLTLLGSITWMEWSVFENLDIIGTKGGYISGLQTALNADGTNYLAHVNTAWKDTYTFNVGANYRLDQNWLLRFGYMYDQNAGQNDKVGITRVPSSNQKWWTTGFNYQFSKSMSMDVAFAYVEPVKVSINDSDVDLQNNPIPGSARAQAKSEINPLAFSAQFNYKF